MQTAARRPRSPRQAEARSSRSPWQAEAATLLVYIRTNNPRDADPLREMPRLFAERGGRRDWTHLERCVHLRGYAIELIRARSRAPEPTGEEPTGEEPRREAAGDRRESRSRRLWRYLELRYPDGQPLTEIRTEVQVGRTTWQTPGKPNSWTSFDEDALVLFASVLAEDLHPSDELTRIPKAGPVTIALTQRGDQLQAAVRALADRAESPVPIDCRPLWVDTYESTFKDVDSVLKVTSYMDSTFFTGSTYGGRILSVNIDLKNNIEKLNLKEED